MINNQNSVIKRYSIIPLLVIAIFVSTRLILKTCYDIELSLLSEETLFLICTSVWLVCVFLIVFRLVLGRFKQQSWYFSFLIVFAKWPIDWLHQKLILLELATNNMWLSLYQPVIWTSVLYVSLRFCTTQTRVSLLDIHSPLKEEDS